MSPWVSAKSYRTGEGAVHHPTDCRYVGENHREVPSDHSLVERLPECDVCNDKHPSGPQSERSCPFCGDRTKDLPAHLPCEESP